MYCLSKNGLSQNGYPAIQLSSYPASPLSSYPAIQLSSYPAIQLGAPRPPYVQPSYLATQLSSYPAIQLSRYPAIQLSSYPALQLSSYPAGRLICFAGEHLENRRLLKDTLPPLEFCSLPKENPQVRFEFTPRRAMKPPSASPLTRIYSQSVQL